MPIAPNNTESNYREAMLGAILRAQAEFDSLEQGGQHAEQVELKVSITPGHLGAWRNAIERDAEDARVRGAWAGEVLSAEERTEAVVSLVAQRVNRLATEREDHRFRRVGLIVGTIASFTTVAIVGVFAIIGYVFQQAFDRKVEADIEGRMVAIESSLDTTLDERFDAQRKAISADIAGNAVPAAVEKQLEIDQLFLEAMILSTRFDLGESYSNSDRDRMIAILEAFQREPAILERPSFITILRNVIDAYVAASNHSHTDKVVGLFPETCWGDAEISATLLEHYGERLAGSSTTDWPEELTVLFEQATAAVSEQFAGAKLAFQLLVATRSDGAPSDRCAEVLDSASLLRPIGADGPDGREVFLDILLNSTHWVFLSRREARSPLRQMQTGREAIDAYRTELYAIADAVRPGLIGDLLVAELINQIRSGRQRDEILAAIDDLMTFFHDRSDVQANLAALRGRI